MKHILFSLALFCLLLSACQKENPAPVDASSSPLLESSITERAPLECHNNLGENSVRVFEYCTGDFVMQGELRLVNAGQMHYVEGYVKCHKLADPDAMVNVAELYVELNGNLSIGCGIPISVNVPSDYNTNLVGGAVQSSESCVNCSSQLLRITYSKEISLVENFDDFLEGKFYLKIDHCGDVFEEEIIITMIGD